MTANPTGAHDPAEMLALLQQQRRTTQSRLVRRYTWVLVVWALAWAVGFGALWFGRDIGGVDVLPAPVAWTVFAVCIGIGAVFSIVVGILAGADTRGRSRFQGMLYGWSWTISMLGVAALTAGFQRAGLEQQLAAVLYPALFILVVGILYLGGGALWRSPIQFVLGIIMIAVAVTATFVGPPTHYLIYGTVGPAAMLVAAVLLARGVLPYEPSPPQETP